jgi:hypothetical protein
MFDLIRWGSISFILAVPRPTSGGLLFENVMNALVSKTSNPHFVVTAMLASAYPGCNRRVMNVQSLYRSQAVASDLAFLLIRALGRLMSISGYCQRKQWYRGLVVNWVSTIIFTTRQIHIKMKVPDSESNRHDRT